MRIAVTGAGGQLGAALIAALQSEHVMVPLGREQFELGTPAVIDQIVASRADLVIHAAAYTNVDGCARDPALAYRINGLGTQYVALACQRLAVPLVYISTNEVFSGLADQPYAEYDPPGPINAYGRSKWVGEQVVRELLTRFYIVRVSWLFGGPRNFVRTVLRLADQHPDNGLRMVDDEIGSPAYAPDVAAAVAALIRTECYGAYHLVNAEYCSRYAFAQAILQASGRAHVPLTPMRLADFRRDSTPPAFAPLANYAGAALGITLRPWPAALAAYLATLAESA